MVVLFPVLLAVQNGLILKGSVLHLLKFRGLSSCSHTGFLTMCGHSEIVVRFALPPYPLANTHLLCVSLLF